MKGKFSLHSAVLEKLSVNDAINLIRKHGYDAIELNATYLPYAEPHITPSLSSEEREYIHNKLKEAGLALSGICCHVNLVNKPIRENQDEIQYTKDCIDVAVDLGADVLEGSSGIKNDVISHGDAWKHLIENMNEIVKYSERKGIKFAVEPIVGMFINNKETTDRMLSEVNKGQVFINFDPSHFLLVNDNIDELVRNYRHIIAHVHIKDAKGNEKQFEFPPLGKGEIDLQSMVNTFKDIGYNGFYSTEYEAHVFGDYNEELDYICEYSLKYMRNLF